jgi:hypothetical protein
MSDTELHATAMAQRAALTPYIPEYTAFVEHCDRIIKRAVAEDKGRALKADGTLV